ncbi:Type II secretory pathway, pseudopilin PulG [Streptococcus suis]|uniref:competence type IV pilus minor pilin ComGE n=1 Tax=Streptococcus suis TaxID=1307 RepID=UPI00114648F7|nr:competence type IV pilus minor pilin ComGE [Streptococcus suis]TQE73706.1 Type II secretory pathway, pseudopilin PulG [Streptococcus suis]
MVAIRNRKNKAYILLEGLVALSVLVTITSLFLSAMEVSRRQQAEDLYQQEVLNVAKMAVQMGQDNLSLNGVKVTVQRSDKVLAVYHEGREVARVEKN